MARTVSTFCLFLACASTVAVAAQVAPAAAAQLAPAAPAAAPAKPPTWEEEVAAWKQARFERLQKPDGWLTLVGLGWLKEGDNSIGSDPGSAVVLPAGKAPARLGMLRLVGSGKAPTVTFLAENGVAVTHLGAPVATLALIADADAKADEGPTVLAHGSLSFFVIRRGDRLGVRVKDRQAATLQAFHGLDYYPLDRKWKLPARFEAEATPKEIPIPNALGFDEPILSPGHVVFTLDGVEHRLLALDDPGVGRLFLVFVVNPIG